MKKLKKQELRRPPSHPGKVLKLLWLDELGISQSQFAETLSKTTGRKIKISTMQTKLSEIINGKRAMNADFAVLISKVLGTNPEMWMKLQITLDIWIAEQDAA